MLVWTGMHGCCRKIVARFDNLAQASLSRLGEMGKDSQKLFSREGSLRRPAQFLSERASRLSENAWRLLFLCVELSPRRRELA